MTVQPRRGGAGVRGLDVTTARTLLRELLRPPACASSDVGEPAQIDSNVIAEREHELHFGARGRLRDDGRRAVLVVPLVVLGAEMRTLHRGDVLNGWGGIRTHGTLSRTHTFQACALNHSATHPKTLRAACCVLANFGELG